MAYVSSELVPSLGSRSPIAAGAAVKTAVKAAFDPLRKRWAYRQFIADLEQYSERNLADIGAERGAEEFARRAAGL